MKMDRNDQQDERLAKAWVRIVAKDGGGRIDYVAILWHRTQPAPDPAAAPPRGRPLRLVWSRPE